MAIYLGTLTLFQTLFVIIIYSLVPASVGLIDYVVWFIYITPVSLLTADRLTEFLLYLIVKKPHDLPQLSSIELRTNLVKEPRRVALLYCTHNDAIRECIEALAKIQAPEGVLLDKYILDDSNETLSVQVRNDLELTDFRVIRRDTNDGFKAGNINNWLQQYGDYYDYFTILDADSILSDDFIESMLCYAEHSDNRDIALFESVIRLRAPQNSLQLAQDCLLAMNYTYSRKLVNHLGIMISNGHNNFCRSVDVDRFDSDYMGEDHATTLNLLARGKRCVLVDVLSYELAPTTLQTLQRRNYRWVRNDLQLLHHSMENVSMLLQFKLWLRALKHIMWIPFVILSLLFVWSSPSTVEDVVTIFKVITTRYSELPYQFKMVLLVLIFYFVHTYALLIPHAYKVGLSPIRYLQTLFVNQCLAIMLSLSTNRAIIHALLRKEFLFDTTPKQEAHANIWQFLRQQKFAVIYSFVAFIGVLYNPVVFIFYAFWVMPVLFGPIIIFAAQNAYI